MKKFAMLVWLMSVGTGCAVAPVTSVENTGTGQAELPVVHQCASRSSIQIGAFASQWANWNLTVDSANFAYVTVTMDSGVAVQAHGGMPLTVRLPGDSVEFTVWTDAGRGHFAQPYPGLVNGYDVEVLCEK